MSEPAQVAVITGGASGIGLATAARLLDDGWSVVIADINASTGAAALAALEGSGHRAHAAFVTCDITQEPEVAALLDAAVERFGGLGCMVNNAGFPGAFGPLDAIEVADWDATFAVLVRGVFLGVKHAIRRFDAAAGGAIVNVASIAGLSGGGGPQAYSAAKAAVISLTKSAAVELAERRIRVNAVAPGPVLTPMLSEARGGPERVKDTLRTTQPWPEAGTAADVAAVIAFLAGPGAGFITGETIVVDGGQTAAGPVAAMSQLSDPRARGLAGISHGTSGRPRTIRRTPDRPEG